MSRRKPPTVHGLVIVDKPSGMTSHDVVGQLRRRLGERRIGHAGTLDPDATGVLVVGVGMVTRLLRYVESTRKTYTGAIAFGTETSTLDAAGEVTARHDMAPPALDDVRAIVADRFTGAIEQIPPMVSAIKVQGRRLHELAREGIEVERAARPVTIHRFDVAATDDPMIVAFEVECSAGTYVRSLAADLGRALGGGAHLASLRRTAVGPYPESEADPIDEAPLRPVAEAVRALTPVVVNAAGAEAIATGKLLPVPAGGPPPWAMFAEDGTLLAVYEPFGRDAKPSVVLAAAAQR